MGDLKVIRTAKTAVTQDVVDILEMYLEDAREGKIDAIAVAIVTPDARVATSYALGRQGYVVAGAVARLQADIVSKDNDE